MSNAYIEDSDQVVWKTTPTLSLTNLLLDSSYTHQESVNVYGLDDIAFGKIYCTMDAVDENNEIIVDIDTDTKALMIALDILFADGTTQTIIYYPKYNNQDITDSGIYSSISANRSFTDFSLNKKNIVGATLYLTKKHNNININVTKLELYFCMNKQEMFNIEINNYWLDFDENQDPDIPLPWDEEEPEPEPEPEPTPEPEPDPDELPPEPDKIYQCIIPLLSSNNYNKYTDGFIDLGDGSVWRAEWHEIQENGMSLPRTKLRAVSSGGMGSYMVSLANYMNYDIQYNKTPSKDNRISSIFNQMNSYSSQGINKNDKDTIRNFINTYRNNPQYAYVISKLQKYLSK